MRITKIHVHTKSTTWFSKLECLYFERDCHETEKEGYQRFRQRSW